MAKFKVRQKADYITGHIRYGHREGVIEADSIEEAKIKIEERGYSDILDLVIDYYVVDDMDFGNNEFEYEEIKEDKEEM